MQALQGRGVRFLSCHSSTEGAGSRLRQGIRLVARSRRNCEGHASVLVVASAAAALALLQCEGRYSYMAV